MNTSGVLRVQGMDQIYLEWEDRSGQLLLTMDLYDEQGKHVAKLRRNAWAFNEKDRFDITTNPESLTLVDKVSGGGVVEARVVGTNKIEIPRGTFYTHRGHLLEITPQYWRIAGGMSMSGKYLAGGGGAVAIG